jgi:hypothetical protein
MLHPQFASPGLATQALIRAGKPSYTTGTLYAICPKIFLEYIMKNNRKKDLTEKGIMLYFIIKRVEYVF